MALPRNGSRPIPELRIFSGYSCKSCNYLTMSRSNMTTHQTEAKHIQQYVGSDRWRTVHMQTFGMCNRFARYWVVSEC